MVEQRVAWKVGTLALKTADLKADEMVGLTAGWKVGDLAGKKAVERVGKWAEK